MKTYLGHPTIDNEVGTVHEGALVASEKHNGMSQLNGFAEAAGRKVHFSPMAFGSIIAEPVLQKSSAGWCHIEVSGLSVKVPTDVELLRELSIKNEKEAYFSGAGQSALNRNPSLA